MENIDSDLIRGNIDTIILKTLLFEDKYGLDIIKEIETRSNGTYELKQPTLYSCLKRLENQKLIESYWVDSEIGGRRHYYKLTEKGREFYNQKQEEWSKSKFIIDNLLSNFNSDEYRLVKKDDYDKIIEGKTFEYNEDQPVATKESSATENDDNDGESEVENVVEESPAEVQEIVEEVQETEVVETPQSNKNESEDEKIVITNPLEPSTRKYYIDNIEDDDNFSQMGFEDIAKTNVANDSSDDETDEESVSEADETEQDEVDDVVDENAEVEAESDENESEYAATSYNVDLTWTKSETDETDDIEETSNAITQEQLFDSDDTQEDDLSRKINEFSRVAFDLQNFDSSGETSIVEEDDDEELESKPISLLDIDDSIKFENSTSYSDFNSYDTEELNDEYEESSEINEEYEEYSFDESDETQDEVIQEEAFAEDEYDNFDYNSYLTVSNDNEETTKESEESNLTDNTEIDDDFFDDLDELSSRRVSTFITSEDTLSYDDIKKNEENQVFQDEEVEEINEPTVEEETFTYQTYTANSESDDKIYNLNTEDSYNNVTFEDYSTTYTDPVIDRYNEAQNYSQTTMFEQANNNDFEPQFTSESYKQKLSTLNEYTNAGLEETKVSTKADSDAIERVKDIEYLKSEFEGHGIRVKEFKRYEAGSEEKNYVLINKLNMVSSLILLFGYIFLLSAVYIVLSSTSFKNTLNFSFVYFVYGIIPFAVFAIYHLVKFFLAPYKKVPAKYSVPITMFIALIVTVQLLLITYCVNLQLGFYSFTQLEYNHLLWIIPLIISFAPLIYNSIYVALFYSKNFNV